MKVQYINLSFTYNAVVNRHKSAERFGYQFNYKCSHKLKSSLFNEILFFVVESSEGGYEAKADGHSIYTEGETLQEVRKSIEDVVRCHFEEFDWDYFSRAGRPVFSRKQKRKNNQQKR